MNLEAILLVPFAGGLLAWAVGRWHAGASRWVALLSLAAAFALALRGWGMEALATTPDGARWLTLVQHEWLPQFGIPFFLGADGLSLLLVLLTLFLGILSVAVSWREIDERVGFFHFNLLWTITGILGVFLALDLFLFFFFWELMIVPMYFLIGIWGHENRGYASTKFFLFTQASGLLMLAAIIGLHIAYARESGVSTFSYPELLNASLPPATAFWLMLGFFVAFAVKLPAVPLHTWLADAHTEAPTAGSLLLAGVLLKTGAYGLLRFALPLFPEASTELAPWAIGMGVAGILYGAKLAFAQRDLKRLVAYSSVSHMGFVLLGAYAGTEVAWQGTVAQMLAHGLSTGALFVVAGALQERLHTRDLEQMGGLWDTMPRLAGVGLFFALASLGLPGLGNFIGEFLILVGAFAAAPIATALAALGLVFATIYSLWLVQKVFHGRRGATPPGTHATAEDLSPREALVFGVLVVLVLWLGIYPASFLRKAEPPFAYDLRRTVEPGNGDAAPSPRFDASSAARAPRLHQAPVADSPPMP
ncbi:MAG TPA: NADH-quinone oxidoreductase subunit M [Opitutaceae bacterium]